MSIIVINAGSSTLKFALFDAEARTALADGLVDWGASQGQAELMVRGAAGQTRQSLSVSDHGGAVAHALHALAEARAGASISVVGHRVVHGGSARESVLVDAGVKQEIARLAELAPLHNPPALKALTAAEAALPGVPQVAVFDTAFFAQLPDSAAIYPLPYDWYTDWGIRRFGFHGISHAYCAARAVEMLGPAAERLVICHLGNGCSATAVQSGRAVATTMGFTPLDGLMMGTRAGGVDPGILLHVLRKRGLDAEQLDQILNEKSGLLGVSGISADYRQVESAAQQGNARARLALDLYARRVRETVGALAVTLGGVDALVFTAGVGENSASLRSAVCVGLECLGVRLDGDRNHSCRADADIAAAESPARILVLHTREELMIAREARRVGGAGRS